MMKLNLFIYCTLYTVQSTVLGSFQNDHSPLLLEYCRIRVQGLCVIV